MKRNFMGDFKVLQTLAVIFKMLSLAYFQPPKLDVDSMFIKFVGQIMHRTRTKMEVDLLKLVCFFTELGFHPCV